MMNLRVIYFLMLSLSILSCQGKQGPTGPPGAGTRIIYEGIASSDEFVVNIPELHLDDFPLVGCYYFFEGAWSALYLDYTTSNGEVVLPFALIEEQKVTLIGLAGLEYKIVIVI